MERRAGTVDVPFLLQISSGGYVRSVAHAMGEMLGCGAHLAALRRVAAGPLRLEQSWTLEQLEAMAGHGDQRADGIAARLPHPRTMLPELPNVTADAGTLARLRHGMLVALPEFSHAPVVKVFEGQDGLAAVARRVAGVLFQPEIVLLS
jgi:tRNA pseudouridine55 synthase